MTMQKLKNRYAFADAESIAAERMRRRGLERFLGSQMLVVAAMGLEAIDAAAATAKDDEGWTSPAPGSGEAAQDDLADAALAARKMLGPDQPGEAENRDAVSSEPSDLTEAANNEKAAPIMDPARNVPSSDAGAAGGGGGEPRMEAGHSAHAPAEDPAVLNDGAHTPADMGGFLDLSIDIARLVDLGDGPSLVVAADIDAPLLPDIGVSLGLFAGEGDQIRLDADAGLISIHASANLPLVANATSVLGEMAESTLATITETATPVTELLASLGALADLGTIFITNAQPANDDPMFEGPAHTSYAMSLSLDAIAQDTPPLPLATSLVEDVERFGDLSADADQHDAAPLSSLALLTH